MLSTYDYALSLFNNKSYFKILKFRQNWSQRWNTKEIIWVQSSLSNLLVSSLQYVRCQSCLNLSDMKRKKCTDQMCVLFSIILFCLCCSPFFEKEKNYIYSYSICTVYIELSRGFKRTNLSDSLRVGIKHLLLGKGVKRTQIEEMKKKCVLERVFEIVIIWQKCQENADGICFNICIWAGYLSGYFPTALWSLHGILLVLY